MITRYLFEIGLRRYILKRETPQAICSLVYGSKHSYFTITLDLMYKRAWSKYFSRSV